MIKVKTGLEILSNDTHLQRKFKGNVALLSHNASIDSNCTHAVLKFKEIFGSRFIKIFGPQHGFSTDVQDNMIETDHFMHPFLKIPVYSLYSETRIPTDEMLYGIQHFFVDLQDIGCRMYTYIYTLTLLLEKCINKDIQIIILDRPNPINGVDIEGNILDLEFKSFIGRHPIPVRHGMTIGEVALMHQQHWFHEKTNLTIIKMQGWKRTMFFEDTGLPWVLPSPNISRAESACTFPATVLFEGSSLSEGRGTTQPLEIIGHPKIEPFSFFRNRLAKIISNSKLDGFVLRPINFLPTFHKHAHKVCGGFQIHVTDKKTFKPWRVGQLLLRETYHHLANEFKWKSPPYEYNETQFPIDIINGTNELRFWVEKNESLEKLNTFENLEEYKLHLEDIKIYK
jgi:uncharacterized protein YbbC (DUF1343 family)